MINLKKYIKNKYNTLLFFILFLFCSFIIGFVGGGLGYKLFFSRDEKTIDDNSINFENTDSNNGISTSEVVALVEDSVVEIETTISSTDENTKTKEVSKGAGSGVILTDDGYIGTNAHVVKEATSIEVSLHSGEKYTAKLIGKDEKEDIAVLKIEASNLKPITFCDSDKIKVGEHVIVIGNPLGTLGGSVTDGIISAIDRTLNVEGETMTLIQTNAEINHGNSGGGMFGEDGKFIGLIVAKSTGDDIEGIGFAIPSNTVRSVTNKIMQL